MISGHINIKNKKAFYQYLLFDKYIAGIELKGTEIKSIRTGRVSLAEAYCTMEEGELFIINLHISEYQFGTYNNHEPKRTRKLLLTKKELKKIGSKINEKGYTLIPIRLFINDKGFAKLEIAVARGKKLYDKRESIKKKDIERDQNRMIRM